MHCKRAFTQGVSAILLRKQDVLRDFIKEYGSGFPATCEKRRHTGVERGMCTSALGDCAKLHFIRSTIFVRTRSTLRVCHAATGGSLHVSHLIHGR
jgi:hypothetical protein